MKNFIKVISEIFYSMGVIGQIKISEPTEIKTTVNSMDKFVATKKDIHTKQKQFHRTRNK